MAERPITRVDKSDVLSGLFAVWDSIDALLDGAPESGWRAATPLPGWDVKAVVSHMIGTESFLAGVAAPQPDIDVSAPSPEPRCWGGSGRSPAIAARP
jgi:uncharacterized protein (TIGR03083 family)